MVNARSLSFISPGPVPTLKLYFLGTYFTFKLPTIIDFGTRRPFFGESLRIWRIEQQHLGKGIKTSDFNGKSISAEVYSLGWSVPEGGTPKLSEYWDKENLNS